MREIKFRGLHTHSMTANGHLDGTWVYGYLVDVNYIVDMVLLGEMLVDPKTIGQYTGLKDKNGVEIYEGDVVKAYVVHEDREETSILTCESIDGLQDLSFWNEEKDWGVSLCYISEGYKYKGISNPMVECEIIGNIHEEIDNEVCR